MDDYLHNFNNVDEAFEFDCSPYLFEYTTTDEKRERQQAAEGDL